MSKVVVQECKSYSIDKMTVKINEGIEKLGGWGKFINAGDRVLLKVAGHEQVAKEEGATIKNFDREGVVQVEPRSKV